MELSIIGGYMMLHLCAVYWCLLIGVHWVTKQAFGLTSCLIYQT